MNISSNRRGLSNLLSCSFLIFLSAACSIFPPKYEPGPYPLRNYDAGPYKVLKNNEFLITDPLQDREIKLRIIYPDAEGPFPVVVFSTGAFCSPQLYDRILDHWVSNGYIVVQPNHMDSPNNDRFPTMDELNNLFPTRMRDVSFILNSLDQIESGMNIQGRIQKDQLAISGHSFGAVISMVKTGLQLKPEAQGEFGPIYDDRFKAAVLLSGVGDGMDEFADNPFDGLRKPFIATGGSKDIGRVRPDKGMDGREWRMQPYLLAPDLDKFSLITDGSDHYLGGLICNAEMGGKPDPESLAIVRAVTNVFLDAYLKNDEEALNYLQTADIQSLTGGRTAYIFNMKE